MTDPATRLPRSLEEMSAMNRVFTDEARERGLAFQPRASDVIISPWNKSGTTWLQHIVHGLRTGGDLDFDDISRVVPWIEVAADLGQDLDAEQVAEPRAFKSHLSYTQIPKGARYIVSLRDPTSVLVSNYRFLEGWFFEPGSIGIDEYARDRWMNRSGGFDYWSHIESWWAVREADNVLLLSFERMKHDLAGTVEQVASFIGIQGDDSLFELVVRQSSLEFMLDHRDRFDDLLVRTRAVEVGALPEGAGSSKVTDGVFDPAQYEVSPEIHETMEANWQETMGARFGIGSFAEAAKQL